MLPLFFCSLHYANSLSFWFLLLCLIGLVCGPGAFYQGFRMLRFKRMILNTPLSRIHSASVGLVEVMGKPVGPHVLTAPVTGEPCYYYRVQAWQWVDTGKEHSWKSVLDECLFVPFYLEDSTGRVLIDPKGAELDVHRSFSDEIGASFFRTRDLLPPHLQDFLVKRGLVPYEKLKLEERIIPQGMPLFVFGTLGENAQGNSGFTASPADASTTVSIRFPGAASDLSSGGAVSANLPVEADSTLAKVLSHVPGVQVETAAAQLQAPVLPPNVFSNAAMPSPNKSAFGDFDPHPSVAIGKGERNEPFAISGHSQRELVGTLAWKSVAYIWGGPVVALVSLYLLMLYLRWIC
jgi:E3 Ubiquitin ligase